MKPLINVLEGMRELEDEQPLQLLLTFMHIADYLETNDRMTRTEVELLASITQPRAYRLVNKMRDYGMLEVGRDPEFYGDSMTLTDEGRAWWEKIKDATKAAAKMAKEQV